MLNKDIMTKWTAALRSGEYTQAHYVLKDTDGGMCCLGVLSEIYQKETGKGEWSVEPMKDKSTQEICHSFTTDVKTSTNFPSREILEWAGFTKSDYSDDNPHFEFASILAGNNDSGQTFAEIADMIDAQVKAEEALTPTS